MPIQAGQSVVLNLDLHTTGNIHLRPDPSETAMYMIIPSGTWGEVMDVRPDEIKVLLDVDRGRASGLKIWVKRFMFGQWFRSSE